MVYDVLLNKNYKYIMTLVISDTEINSKYLKQLQHENGIWLYELTIDLKENIDKLKKKLPSSSKIVVIKY